MLLPLLTAALLAGDTTRAETERPRALDETVALSVHRQPAVPLVSLRLALLASDPPGYAGAGHLVQHLLYPSLVTQAALVGARVQMERTADAVVYTLTGPTAELGYMAELLRAALRPAAPSPTALLRASRELAEERLAEWETAEKHVRSVLRLRLFPEEISGAGTEPAAARLAAGDAVRAAWAAMYRPERVFITAVGDVTLEQVRNAFGELPAVLPGAPRDGARDTVSTAPLAPAEATRGWLALGYPASTAEPAVLSVAARVVGDRLRTRLPGATVASEHWWTHHGQALALVAAVHNTQITLGHRVIATAVSGAAETVTEEEVRAAAQSIRRDLLFFSRTPDRMAAVLGQFSDRTGNADEAQRFHDELGRVTMAEVRELLETLAARTPARVDIPPQRLMRR
jgi:predicted Zn-dependent peptidase